MARTGSDDRDDERTATIDIEAVRAKYREERDKRGGGRTYQFARGAFGHYARDPNAGPLEREPLTDEVDVAVVGAGIGGLLIGARLRESCDLERIRLIDAAGDVGGTWYWNRFPGVRCDVESYIYMPLLEELGTVPTEKYATGPEILAHLQAVARHYGLYRDALFQTSVTALHWDEAAGKWLVRTDRGDLFRARYVCMSIGLMHRPKLPSLPGLESFAGHSFHASRWDFAYTGGDSEGGLHKLRDKRVGVIGTGSTTVQIAPHLAEWSERLYVFQRTPAAVDVRGNRPTPPDWAADLAPGWQQRRMENFHALTSGLPQDEDLVRDRWTQTTAELAAAILPKADGPGDPRDMAAAAERADFLKMEELRDRIDGIIADPETAAALKPYFRLYCKRPCFHDGYLQTYNQPHVTLVDTQGKGVERLTRTGVVAGGTEYPVDCLVFATGYEHEFAVPYTSRAGYDIVGRDGLKLSEKWESGARTFHGLQVHGFPNCFILSKAQSGRHVNIAYMLNEQSKHLSYIVKSVEESGHRVVEASEAGEKEWVEEILRLATDSTDFLESCTPGLYNNEGKPGDLPALNSSYGGGSVEFVNILRRWREAGDLARLELR
ncbi:neopentalenolactone/pentalenolactone D synthase [Streptomyces silaceus]|uniref:neopentalenolactone/pentalenolactone D synthase n=1 Tax=Streptomyces silaceus TaxID=545123 RepID=UPI00099EF2B9|nr:NAD(P)/FAD-dependent oxidoreductase [Streptomyces silaceus]